MCIPIEYKINWFLIFRYVFFVFFYSREYPERKIENENDKFRTGMMVNSGMYHIQHVKKEWYSIFVFGLPFLLGFGVRIFLPSILNSRLFVSWTNTTPAVQRNAAIQNRLMVKPKYLTKYNNSINIETSINADERGNSN